MLVILSSHKIIAFNFGFSFFKVLIAVGRDACTRNIGLDTIGVKINEK